MARATLGKLEVRAFVPRALGLRAQELMDRALGPRLSEAITEQFAPLDDVDAGAVWVIRDLHVSLAVGASETDPMRQASRIAEAIALAIERVVALGPSADAVRFPSGAAYVASYVKARLAEVGTGWVHEQLAVFNPLPASDALIAAARALELPLAECIVELAGQGGWHRLVGSAAEDQVDRLALAVEALASGVKPDPVLVATARFVRGQTVGGRPVDADRSDVHRRRLHLLGALALSHGVTPEVVASVWLAEAPSWTPEHDLPGAGLPALPGRSDGERRPGWPGIDKFAGSPQASADAGDTGQPSSLITPGAVAFMLLTDLDELIGGREGLRGDDPAAGVIRRLVLRGVFRDAVSQGDPALWLAAGSGPPARPPHGAELVALLDDVATPWAASVAADRTLGWRHHGDVDYFAPAREVHPALAPLSAGLLRLFAQHLPGFGHAGPDWLVPRLLPTGGRVVIDQQTIDVQLPSPPLHVVLSMARLDTFVCRVPWLDLPVTISHQDER